MLIVPAIDVRGGKVVRLLQGDFSKETVFGDDPLDFARRWASLGARRLHVVDLDGAKSGVPHHLQVVARIAREVVIPVEIGGGIRTMETIDRYLTAGVAYVVLGTKACSDERFLTGALKAYGGKIVAGVDVKDGTVATEGWLATAGGDPAVLVERLVGLGVQTIIYTDIARDGAMTGPAAETYKKLLSRTKGKAALFASGGVSSLEDLLKLKELESQGLAGAIVGRALYEGTIDLKEAVAKC
ncbi:MAG: 1-(5-phosphoribosyl)-5-[(5-phosphoribosylamino)methylideneamino]imidazole-4-carboxamide isomerase [Candidatus Omnitrophica bacterium]|nr:1-(5-phosphoribosyl)-5-[(5-phosphoribosylamino)methylideneamino]imidazole-4-carboxamide isomerase [Candidatus Omnitrophota bacterium]